MNKRDVGEKIKKLREARRMSQNALANQAGVSPTYIYQLERGEKSPTVEYLDHICWGLGITIEEFFQAERISFSVENRIDSLTSEQKQLLNQFLNSL